MNVSSRLLPPLARFVSAQSPVSSLSSTYDGSKRWSSSQTSQYAGHARPNRRVLKALICPRCPFAHLPPFRPRCVGHCCGHAIPVNYHGDPLRFCLFSLRSGLEARHHPPACLQPSPLCITRLSFLGHITRFTPYTTVPAWCCFDERTIHNFLPSRPSKHSHQHWERLSLPHLSLLLSAETPTPYYYSNRCPEGPEMLLRPT